MDPTRRLLDRLTAWSPVLLLGGLAALTYWLDAQVQAPGPDKPARARHEPDMFIENFRAVSFGADGKPRQSLAAKRAQHYADDQPSDLVEPRLEMAEPGKPRLSLSAERGRLAADREHALFSGGVRAVRDAPPGQGGDALPGGRIVLTTEELAVSSRDERLTTDKPVTIEEPRGIIRGVGLEFDNVARTVHLKSQVSGTLQPATSSK